MENRSSKLPLSKWKYQSSSCIWGLVDMFDIRTGSRTNQKLLSNGRKIHKNDFDVQRSRKVDKLGKLCEKWQDIEGGANLGNHAVDDNETKLKAIMQEEFPTEKQMKRVLKAMKQQCKRSDFESMNEFGSQILADHRKKKNHQGYHPNSCSDKVSSDSHNFAAMLEEICSQAHQHGRCNGGMQRSITPSIFKQLDETNVQLLQMSAKAFIDQIYMNRRYMSKNVVSRKSKPFSDASELLHLNRDLFLKLLQDPNSLLAKHIKNLQFPPRERKGIKLFLDSESSECQTSGNEDSKSTMSIQKKNANDLLWQNSKHRHGFSLKRNTTSASNEIVVLKPVLKGKKNPENVSCHCSSLQSHHRLKSRGKSAKSTYFSFKDIRRKLKRAVGESQRDKHWISLDDSLIKLSSNKKSLKYVDKGISHSISRGDSASVNDDKRMERQPKPKSLTSRKGPEIDFNSVSECKRFNSSTTSCSMQRQLDIIMEAKRDLSERLKNVNVAEALPRKQTTRTLQMIISSPYHDFLITRSPKRDMSASASTQMRFSPYGNIEKGKGVSLQSPHNHNKEVELSADSISDDQMEFFGSRSIIPEKIDDDTEVCENICAIGDNLKPNGYIDILEENESILSGSLKILEARCEPNKVDSTCEPSVEATKLSEDNGYESSSFDDSSEDHHQQSLLGISTSPLHISALETVDTCKYREGHPSPVSVLEPFSPEEANSPTNITAKQDECLLQPRHIDFDDHSQVKSPEDPKVDITESIDDEEEYMSACVRAVMQTSNLKFDDLLASSHSSLPRGLKTYTVDSVGLFQVESNCELNLQLDCIHQVLLGVCDYYFGYSPWLSFLKPNIRPAPMERNVIDEVVKEVNCYTSPKLGQPTLDQLVQSDMAKFGLWLELRPDTEDIVIQIAEDVLQESVLDTILELQI
ncbi:hypothetical protein ACH5RR_038429 [Cinchona calisaya]|uniref:DUF4378 domain-containing protein n=1 Tax=Cinchona calisaya TaxID=153742 RepID=A0ABD2XX36_9GENT